MTENLYIIIEERRRGWPRYRISKCSKHKPRLPRPTEQALVKLEVNIPDNVMQPREVRVEIKPEHLQQPAITVESQKP